MKFYEKLKAKWGITSDWQAAIIFIVFGLTGSSAVKLGGPILEYFNVTKEMSPWVFWPLRILIITPIYQVLLIIYGTLFGQFKFFWNMEKKMLKRMGINLDKTSEANADKLDKTPKEKVV